MDAVKTYALLTKPGIILGNVITIAGGFALASTAHFSLGLLAATLSGLSLLIASSCILNNYIDRHLDRLMERTKNRPLARGVLSIPKVLLLSFLLGSSGLFLLMRYTNFLTVCIALSGFLIYVIFYGFYKRKTHYGTLIGSLAGAVPPVVGYCAASNRFDLTAALLFLLLIVWQMPHFFAIALYRLDDYTAARLPIHPIQKGIGATKVQMTLYVALFMLLALALAPASGRLYLFSAVAFSLWWLYTALRGFHSQEVSAWAKKMFAVSLWTILALFLALVFA